MENRLIFIISALLLSYLLYRLFSIFNKKTNKANTYQKSIEEILTSEKYKVKGKYD